MALALYRRYRPDTFAGVIGQDQVTVPLCRALDSGRLTHAYMFSGPRGCGKTSCARILARCVNCAKGPTSHPCGKCASCRDLANGGPGSIDVVEIDAASHNGVDDARELRERAGFAPVRDRYKIFILDEAHMVTQQGFNALLKIVEEPPEHVMFIFATTEPGKVISTIRSRTHHYPFRLVPPEVMGPYLQKICAKEHVTAAAGVLRMAMRAGGGSVRDTLSVLDQLMVGAVDGTITHQAAEALLGFTPTALLGEAIEAVIDRNGKQLYGVIEKVIVGGYDPRRFVEDLLARIRDLLVLTLGGGKAESTLSDDPSSDDLAVLRRQAHALGLQALTALAGILDDGLASMVGAVSPRMRLELLAARLLAARERQMAGAVETIPPRAGSPAVAHPTAAGRHVGFVGAQRRRAASPESSATSQSVAGTAPTAAAPRPVSPHTTRMTRTTPQPTEPTPVASRQTQAQSQEEDARTPDQRWDAVVAALPQDVRDYIDRKHIPHVSLTIFRPGRQRLMLTFDTPVSEHAFALAVCDKPVNGQTGMTKVVQAQVRREFGANTQIVPAGTAANGEHVESVRRMAPERLTEVKRQIALAKAGLQLEATDPWAASSSTPHPAPSAAHNPSAGDPVSDDAASGRNRRHASGRFLQAPVTPGVKQASSTHPTPPSIPADHPQSNDPKDDPEDESEYTPNDPSLPGNAAMSVDELKAMFDVTHVEQLPADDPQNPTAHGMQTTQSARAGHSAYPRAGA